MPTLQHLAEAAGVNKSTVSLALRNHPRISEDTRARIQALARQLGYRPHPHLQAFMSQVRRRRVGGVQCEIGWINARQRRNDWERLPNLRGFLRGAAARALELGYRVESYWLNEPGMSTRRLEQILLQRSVAGLIYPSHEFLAPEVQIDWRKFCNIAMYRPPRAPVFHHVCPHFYHNFETAWHRLEEQGRRRIGYVTLSPKEYLFETQFQSAMLYCQSRLPAKSRLPLLRCPDPEQPADALRAWLDRWQPDAVLLKDDRLLELLRPAGGLVPPGCVVAHLRMNESHRGICGIDEQNGQVGRLAVEQLIGMINRHETGAPSHPFELLVRGRWRQSG